MVITKTAIETTSVAHPAAAPSFRCLPERVSGTPILRDILDFAADIPKSRLQEKPPLFIMRFPILRSADEMILQHIY